MGYLRTVLTGISWSVGQRWVVRGLTVIRLAVLARILKPAQFGVFGVATLVLGFLETFTETSINLFLVQEKKEVDPFVNTAWVISMIRGVLIALLIFFGAQPVSDFFNSPDSVSVLKLMSLVPLLRGLINPSVAKMQKNLLFKNEFAYKTVLFSIDAAVSITLSIITRNASGLVYGMLFSAIFEVILSFWLFHPRPRLHWDGSAARQIVSRGKWITAASIFNYFYQNADNLVVGRLLGESSLGIYSSAYKLSSMPVSEVSDVVARVTFPVYVRMSDDTQRLKVAFVRSSYAITAVSTLFGGVIFLFAEPIVKIVLGPDWLAAIPVLRVLSAYGIFKSISNTVYPLFLATKNQQYITYVNFISCFSLGVSIIPLVQKWGIMGAGYAAIIGALASIPFSLYYVRKIIRSFAVSNIQKNIFIK